MGLRSKAGATRLVYWTSGPEKGGLGAWCHPLAGHSTELVGERSHQEDKDVVVVAGAGLPSRHREAEALQEAGEEEEQFHAGQGLPKA